jgi:hypothetical protein
MGIFRLSCTQIRTNNSEILPGGDQPAWLAVAQCSAINFSSALLMAALQSKQSEEEKECIIAPASNRVERSLQRLVQRFHDRSRQNSTDLILRRRVAPSRRMEAGAVWLGAVLRDARYAGSSARGQE